MTHNKRISGLCYHAIAIGLGIVMIYPLLWMFTSSFKESSTIFTTAKQLVPQSWTLENYINGWSGFANITFTTFFKNTIIVSVLATIGTVVSSSLVAYGFSRCEFPGKKILFAAMLVTMMLPVQVLMVPRYLWYQQLNWIGTYLPMIVPYFFGVQGFCIYLVVNFMQGIPRDLDEAAKIDGCSHWGIFWNIMVPLAKPAFVTITIFSFMWRWNDFLAALIYINKPTDYTISIALKLFCDPTMGSDYGAMFAMAIVSLLPIVLVFILFEKHLTEGITTTGLKG